LFVSLWVLHTLIFERPDTSREHGPTVAADDKQRVAIVGGGPSGLGALWALKRHSPQRDVTVFEAAPQVGGHSTTVYDGPDGPPIDIGFIFSTPHYESYGMLTEHYNVTRKQSRITVAYHGDYGAFDRRPPSGFAGWDNVGEARTHAEPALMSDIGRFRAFVHEKGSMLRALMPLGLWLWWEGFSADFEVRVLRPLLTPLFVTAKGCMYQSAQATINHFHPLDGFLSLDLSADAQPPLFHTVGGVRPMYEALLADMAMPSSHLRLSTRVMSVRRHGTRQWKLTSFGPLGRRVEIFDQVILACSAAVQATLLDADDVPTLSWLVRHIDYDAFDVRLSVTDAADPLRTSSTLYQVYPNSELVGSIDRILDVGGGDYKLEVWPHETATAPTRPGRVVATREWEHHRFSLWELLLTKRLLPRLNHLHGLHIAGDWTEGVGQNDALKSGFKAACAVGMTLETKVDLWTAANQTGNPSLDMCHPRGWPGIVERRTHRRRLEPMHFWER